jgi:hypothetical protein
MQEDEISLASRTIAIVQAFLEGPSPVALRLAVRRAYQAGQIGFPLGLGFLERGQSDVDIE